MAHGKLVGARCTIPSAQHLRNNTSAAAIISDNKLNKSKTFLQYKGESALIALLFCGVAEEKIV